MGMEKKKGGTMIKPETNDAKQHQEDEDRAARVAYLRTYEYPEGDIHRKERELRLCDSKE